ncbi:serine/threonine-protein kinase 17A-like isoform X2 [Mytilus californianus]|nr:serine/threonine-protein kinase 17A-like isoform X2 [Mytilus californianus]XP_052091912.1 serine/threonine-protein kinase 17A-like isoform X2 [Mytilus californianus]
MLENAISHPRLVQLLEVFETPTELILITEYCSGGELFHECVTEESFEERDVVKIMKQILEGLDYLHQRNIVHLDIKPQNILLTHPFPKGDIKLCDLGFACLVNTGEDIRDIIGTVDYVAPEVLDYEPLGLHTDMWSLGVLAYVMLTAHSPFADDNQQKTFLNISQVNLEFPESLFSHLSSASQDFICKLLVKHPKNRMNTKQCLEHPWISGIVSPETLLGNSETCKNSEENMIESCDELEEKSDVIAEKEIPVEIVKKCSESSNSLPSEHKDLNLVLEEPENIDREDSIPSKVLKCNSNSNILDECEKTKGTENMTCSENECMKDSYKMDDVNSNLSTQAVV